MDYDSGTQIHGWTVGVFLIVDKTASFRMM